MLRTLVSLTLGSATNSFQSLAMPFALWMTPVVYHPWQQYSCTECGNGREEGVGGRRGRRGGGGVGGAKGWRDVMLEV